MLRRFLLTLFISVTCAATAPAGDSREEAVRLAEEAIKGMGLYQGKIYLTGIELMREGDGATARRHAIVTHYRYDGNLGIVTALNLDEKKVLRVEATPNLPTSLAADEAAAVRKLALDNAEVAKAMARYRSLEVETDAVVTYTVDPRAFGYGHRLVRLFFRQGRDYLLYAPNVDVDLTTGAVRVERNDQPHK